MIYLFLPNFKIDVQMNQRGEATFLLIKKTIAWFYLFLQILISNLIHIKCGSSMKWTNIVFSCVRKNIYIISFLDDN